MAGTAAALGEAIPEVAVAKPKPLQVVVRFVPDPDPAGTRRRVEARLADGIAEVLIAEQRGRVAARLGCDAAAIDREAGRPEAVRFDVGEAA